MKFFLELSNVVGESRAVVVVVVVVVACRGDLPPPRLLLPEFFLVTPLASPLDNGINMGPLDESISNTTNYSN